MGTFKRSVGRNFDPYLVGLQWAADGGTPLFTIGNFQITTNLTAPPTRNFQLGTFSDPITLENLGTTLLDANALVNNNLGIYLNLNTENLLSFTLFGSFKEFVRVELEQIVKNWPGSIYVFGAFGSVTGPTYTNYNFNSATNSATFDVSTNFFYNNFGINFLQSATSLTGTSITTSLSNLTLSYSQYTIYVNGVNYPIIGFVGSTTVTNGTVTITVSGDPFNGGAVATSTPYNIRPNDTYLEIFFSNLSDFGRFLLNRQTVPIYSCTIFYEELTENFLTLQRAKKLNWPTSDGYNIEVNTSNFSIYKQQLLAIAEEYDSYRTDLMKRVLVTESISYFELNPRISAYYPINTTDKIEKLLNIYGREFDEVRKYIEGISFAATVSYNRQGNVPDSLIKDFAYYLGWDLLAPMEEDQLVANFIPTTSTFSGMTLGYTPAEAEVEFWRRLVLNSAFIWKSKGTRKGVEFLFDFINVPQNMVTFNEYIYQAKNKLNVNVFKQILQTLYGTTNLDGFNVDEDGYPVVPQDTLDMYFQKGGGWYRETAGINSLVDNYEGNNPHTGPYDAGQEYINTFRCLLNAIAGTGSGAGSSTNPYGQLSGQTLTITNEYVQVTNLFANYYGGSVNGYAGNVYVDTVDINNNPSNCLVVTGTVVDNPSSLPELTVCGCPIPSGITKAILINVKKNTTAAISCSSTTLGSTAILGDLLPCKGCTPSSLNSVDFTIIYACTSVNGLSITELVPIGCCQSKTKNVNFTWIEYQNTETGFCYYDDPCKNNYQYIGNFYWRNLGTGVFTNFVPKNCCLYRGGIYNEFTGECLPN